MYNESTISLFVYCFEIDTEFASKYNNRFLFSYCSFMIKFTPGEELPNNSKIIYCIKK